MRYDTFWIGILAVSLLVAGCSTPGQARRDFEVYYEDGGLDSLEFDVDGGDLDLEIERERLGTRFAFGTEKVRGFFHLVAEEWNVKDSGADDLGGYGFGGGLKGAPTLSAEDADVKLLIPFRADVSGVYVEDRGSHEDVYFVYGEFHAEAGFGVDWMGLRPSAGVAFSYVAGEFTIDPSSSRSVDDKEHITVTGANVGFFVDLVYKHERFPLFAHIRALVGDYEVMTIGIGVKF